MYLRESFRIVSSLIFFVVMISALVPSTTLAQTCTGSRRPIQAGDIERAAKLGITIPPDTTCVDKNILGEALDSGAEEAIEFLKTRICPGLQYGIPANFNQNDTSPQNWTPIRNGYVYFTGGGASMNPGAMKCFKQFFEAAEQRGLQPCIRAALRSPAHQRSSCTDPGNSTVCGRSGRGTGGASSCSTNLGSYMSCPHVNGLALDVNDKGGRLTPLLAFARSTGLFSKVGAGAADPWHIEAASCADSRFNQNPDLADSWNGAPPSTGLANTIRQAFGLPTQQNQVSVGQPAVPSQPVSTSQNPLSAFNEPQAAPGVSTQINTSVNTTGSSSTIATRLEELAFGPKPATSTAATSVPLVVNGSDAATLTGSQNPTAASTTSVTGITTPVQQTFTSGDLSWQGESVSSNPVSGMTAIFITLKSALTRLLQYLTPFGARSQTHGDGEMGE
ncbi:MAG: hypothetical protein WAZ27_03180 [Minisyncoccia bacterium]